VKGEAPRLINRSSFGSAVKSINDPALKLLFISRGNPVVQLPNTNEVVSAMESIEFKVSLEHFLTDTAQMADIVLPVTYFLEEEDVAVPGMWSHYAGRIGKCLDRFYEARPEYEIYTELAERLGYEEFPKLTGEQWLELMLKPMLDKGLKLEELKEKGYTHNPISLDIPWQDGKFATGSGRFELISAEALGKYFQHLRAGDREKYRLIFVHSRKSMHSQHMMDEDGKLPTVYFHQEDAEVEDIKSGDAIRLFNDKGSIEAVAGISASGVSQVLYMEQGWWLKNGGGVNSLTSDGISDIGNQGIMNYCFCDIKKVRID
jgi:anaerobic selenocysteine-containing dehydrogenase